eukprot:scaffold20550_cov58-Cyclotella_meneghiniana.AAC.1
MAMRALLRELGICRRQELLGLLPSNVVGLILLHEPYATEEMIVSEGAYPIKTESIIVIRQTIMAGCGRGNTPT